MEIDIQRCKKGLVGLSVAVSSDRAAKERRAAVASKP